MSAEQAYLVERGVRALAVVGSCLPGETASALTDLARAGAYSPGAVIFAVERPDGLVDYGYAASGWAADLYQWAWRRAIPVRQRERIFGLLFGYSPDAIERFEARLPVGLTPSCSSPRGDSADKEGTHLPLP